jgi:TusA-related sulfurtransferase
MEKLKKVKKEKIIEIKGSPGQIFEAIMKGIKSFNFGEIVDFDIKEGVFKVLYKDGEMREFKLEHLEGKKFKIKEV